jgi:hypothetical protein
MRMVGDRARIAPGLRADVVRLERLPGRAVEFCPFRPVPVPVPVPVPDPVVRSRIPQPRAALRFPELGHGHGHVYGSEPK